MVELEWAHFIAGLVGALGGAAGGIFAGGWRLGRVVEGLKLAFKKDIDDSKEEIEEKLEQARTGFDETLKGLRQKINDVELDAERRFLQKDEFNDFRQEYRQDMQRIFDKLDSIPVGRRSQ